MVAAGRGADAYVTDGRAPRLALRSAADAGRPCHGSITPGPALHHHHHPAFRAASVAAPPLSPPPSLTLQLPLLLTGLDAYARCCLRPCRMARLPRPTWPLRRHRPRRAAHTLRPLHPSPTLRSRPAHADRRHAPLRMTSLPLAPCTSPRCRRSSLRPRRLPGRVTLLCALAPSASSLGRPLPPRLSRITRACTPLTRTPRRTALHAWTVLSRQVHLTHPMFVRHPRRQAWPNSCFPPHLPNSLPLHLQPTTPMVLTPAELYGRRLLRRRRPTRIRGAVQAAGLRIRTHACEPPLRPPPRRLQCWSPSCRSIGRSAPLPQLPCRLSCPGTRRIFTSPTKPRRCWARPMSGNRCPWVPLLQRQIFTVLQVQWASSPMRRPLPCKSPAGASAPIYPAPLHRPW